MRQALCIISNPSVNSNWSYSPETLDSSQTRQFLSRVTLKFDGWPWKTTRHLVYATLNFVHNFKAIGEFKLRLQSGNARFGPKSGFFVPLELEIWWMTLKNNRASFLCCFKISASFHSYQWILTGVTVRKCPMWVKIDAFCPVWPWKLTDDLEKQQGTSYMLLQALCIIW